MKPFAVVGSAALIAAGGTSVAAAAETDAAEAEGQLVNTGSLAPIAALEGAYSADEGTGGEPDSTNLDLSALGLVDLTIPTLATVELAELIDLGVVAQFADSGVDGAVGASGALTETGLIDAGAGADPTNNSVVDLEPLLAGIDAEGVISDLTLELGAVAAWAEATRGTSVDIGSDYLLGDATVDVASPALAGLTGDLDGLMGALDADVNDLVGTGGSLTGALGAVEADLEAILATVPLPDSVTDVSIDEVATAVDLDLSGVLDTALAEPLVDDDGTVTIDLTEGSVSIDLSTLYELNDLDPNTTLLTDTTLNATIQASVEDLLINELPSRLAAAVADALETTELTASIATTVGGVENSLGTLDLDIAGSLASFLGIDGAPAPTLDVTGEIAGITLDELLTLVEGPLGVLVLPLVGDAVSAVLDTDALALAVEELATDTVTALEPMLELVNEVVTVTVNVQEEPGTFDDPRGFNPGSFTQRAVALQVLPELDGPVVALASATVRAIEADDSTGPEDVVITAPTPGTEYEVPGADDTTDVDVTGTGEPGASIEVTVDGEVATATVNDDGDWTVPFVDLPVGDYDAVAEQFIDGDSTGTDTTDFSVVVDDGTGPGDVEITSPTPGTEYEVPGADDTTDVDVTGTGEPGATIEVTVGGDTVTTVVDGDGNWTVTIEDVPVGDHDATAEQFIDGDSTGTDATDFTVVVEDGTGPDGSGDLGIVIERPVIERGGVQAVIGTGFQPGESVTGEQLTGSLDMGTAVADANGTVRFSWQIPAGNPLGANDVLLTGADSGSIGGTFSVVADAGTDGPGTGSGGGAGDGGAGNGGAPGGLAQTGAETGGLIALATLLLGLGAAGVIAAVRRGRLGHMAG